VVVGALCEDIIRGMGPTRREIGGTAYYFSSALVALGARVGCVTKAEDEWMTRRIREAGVSTDGIQRGRSCCFELTYRGGDRQLRLLRHSSKIDVGEVPAPMLSFDGLHLGPVEEELGDNIWDLRDRFNFISLDIQGLARSFGREDGEVSIRGPLRENSIKTIGASDVVKFSREEALELLGPEPSWEDQATHMAELGPPVTIITLGPEGALLYEKGVRTHIPPYPSEPLDWTGAGDCFMAGFDFMRLSGRNSVDSAHFGSALAACVIESPRPVSFPDLEVVEAKMAKLREG
jgi:sugar/nucleoside kinase (ribokinase family)